MITGDTAAASVFGRDARARIGSRKRGNLLKSGLRFPTYRCVLPAPLRQLIEERALAAEIEEADLSVAVRVQRGLEEPQRHRRHGHISRHHFTSPPPASSEGTTVLRDHIQCLLCVVLAAEEPDFARFLLTDDAGEVGRPEPRSNSRPSERFVRNGRIRSDRQIADDMQDP